MPGGVDFSNCQTDETGMCCVYKDSKVQSLSKEPVLECNHKNVEKCHYTYVTQFEPAQEEMCEENFEKTCQITFRQIANKETVQKCLTPLKKVCDQSAAQPQYGQPQYGGGRGNGGGQQQSQAQYGGGSGQAEEECRTFYESSCTTRYIEKSPGKFVGDTQCEKQPVKMCGQGCRMEQGEPECHDKEIDTLLDVPEEVCDLNPQKTCRYVTRLVPRLKPVHECTVVPQETCNLKFSPPKQVEKPLKSKWCIDPNADVVRDNGGYEESQAAAAPIGYNAAASAPQTSYAQPAQAPTSYAQPAQAPTSYAQPAPAAPAPSSYAQPASNGYNAAASEPASTSYAQPATDSYGAASYEYEYEYEDDTPVYEEPSAPASNTYAQPASDSYSQPASDSYSQPASDSYSQPAPAAPAPSSYSEPASDSYSQPASDSYSQPASDSYSQPAPSAPAPSSYSQPASNSYSQPAPAAPAPSSYSQNSLPTYGSGGGGAKPTPGPVYYKPMPEKQQPSYSFYKSKRFA